MTDPTKEAWTPGPWGVNARMSIWVMAGDLHVATIPRAADGDWSPHNAHLIAAAPELYAALAELCALDDDHGPFGGEIYQDRVEKAWATARTALAKARGES